MSTHSPSDAINETREQRIEAIMEQLRTKIEQTVRQMVKRAVDDEEGADTRRIVTAVTINLILLRIIGRMRQTIFVSVLTALIRGELGPQTVPDFSRHYWLSLLSGTVACVRA